MDISFLWQNAIRSLELKTEPYGANKLYKKYQCNGSVTTNIYPVLLSKKHIKKINELIY